jgi:hypothetical protein
MKFNKNLFWKLIGLFAVMDLCWLMAGCGNWESEVSSIIALLGPAIQAAIALLAAFGVGVSEDVITAFNTWSTQAQAALTQIEGLVAQYKAALASAQPGILNEIQVVVNETISNLTPILTTLHITDQSTQAKVLAVFSTIAGMLGSVSALIPVIQGKVEDVKEQVRLYTAYKDARKGFKEAYDKAVDALGPKATAIRNQYKI